MSQVYLTDEEYDFIYSRSPRICVDLLVKNSKGEVLLTKRTIEPYINHWHFPGGRIKFRESIQGALSRICLGELGVDINKMGVTSLLGCCEYPDEVQKEQPRHSISLVHGIVLMEDVELKAQDKYEWCSSVPELIIPPVGVFLKSKNIL